MLGMVEKSLIVDPVLFWHLEISSGIINSCIKENDRLLNDKP